MTFKKWLSAVTAAATLSSAAAAMAIAAHAETETANAVVANARLLGTVGTNNQWNDADCVANGSVVADIDGNAQYEATFNLAEGSASIDFLFLEIAGPADEEGALTEFTGDKYPDLSVTVDEIYVDGTAVGVTANDAAYNLAHYENNYGAVRVYLSDTWGINSNNDLGLTAPAEGVAEEIKVVFSVAGLYNDGTSNVTTESTEPTEPSTEAPTDVTPGAGAIAVAQLNGQFGTYNYWGEDSDTVTGKAAYIDGNAQYEAVLNITGDGTGSEEFLILEITGADGTDFTADVYPNLGITIDNIYVDGINYEFTDNADAYQLKWYENGGKVRIFIADTWGINGSNDLGLTSAALTAQLKVVFTVSGLYNEGTSNVTPTEPLVPTYVLGDVDGDGEVNSSDASSVLSAYAITSTGGDSGYTETQTLAADVNFDNSVDSSDASSILSYYAYTSTGGTGSIEEFLG